jgi:hypothetical protein
VSSAAAVWLNGEEVGRHVGHFIAFERDVTQHVRFGGQNTLAILAKQNSIARSVSGYAVHVGGGITRKIEMFCVPSTNVAMMHATPTFDESYEHAVLNVEVEIANEGSLDVDRAELRFELTDPEGRAAVFEPRRSGPFSVAVAEPARQQIRLAVTSPQHWEAEHPRLYRLNASLWIDGRCLETVSRRIGFRQIEIRGNELHVNGKPVKLRGTDRHEAHPQRGRSLTPQLSRQDAELFKAANCNFVRTSHYPPCEEFIEACDELGLYVEEEAPFCFFNSGNQQGMKQDDVTRYVVYANLKMVERDLTHPSVLIWSIGNESSWAPHFEAAAQAVARRDPSRPRTFMWFHPEADELTVAAEHYPTPESVEQVDRDRPKLFSEYCHLPAYVPHEMYTDPAVDDEWGRLLEATWENLYPTRGALGGAVWCGVDDVFHVPPSGKNGSYSVRGVAAWGVLDGWRRPKPEYWHMLKCYSPLHLLEVKVDLPPAGKPVRVAVENRYDFTNLSELEIAWRIGNRSGMAVADVAPRSRGDVLIPCGEVAEGESLHLWAHDALGRLVDEYELPIGDGPMRNVRPSTSTVVWNMRQTDTEVVVQAGDATCTIDRATAQITKALVKDHPVLIGGPCLAFVPTFSKIQQRAMKGEQPRPTPVHGSSWTADTVTARQVGSEVEVGWSGSCDGARGEGTFRFAADGDVEIHYQVALDPEMIGKEDLVRVGGDGLSHMGGKYLALVQFRDDGTALVTGKQPNEKPLSVPAQQVAAVPRQLGMLFNLPLSVDTLRWDRRGQWSVYPDHHVGRPIGTARAFLPERDTHESLGERPDWPWSLAACELGTRDFRSTKANIFRATLIDSQGYGVEVISDGTQNARAFVQDGRVNWLIAQINNPPSETFMAGYFDRLRTAVPLGKPISGSIHLRFCNPSSRER